MHSLRLIPFIVAGAFTLSACIPAEISRIGPPRAPKPKDCEIVVLEPGENPDRPWVDIGAVLVENCQEYHVGLCRKWVTQKACELGGEIAYLPNPEPPKDEFVTNVVSYRVLVAVFAVTADAPLTEVGCAEPKAAAAADTEGAEAPPMERCLE